MGESLLWVLMVTMFNPQSKSSETLVIHTFEKQGACLDATMGLVYLRGDGRDKAVKNNHFPAERLLENAYCVPLGKYEAVRKRVEAGM